MSVSSKPEHTNGDTCLVGQFLGALKKPPQSEILPYEAKTMLALRSSRRLYVVYFLFVGRCCRSLQTCAFGEGVTEPQVFMKLFAD